MVCPAVTVIANVISMDTARQWEREADHPPSFSGTRLNSPGSYGPAWMD